MAYLAAVAVDRRQRFILSADKLKEMTGGSALIASTVATIDALVRAEGGSVVRPVSGEVWFTTADLDQLRRASSAIREKLLNEMRMPFTFAAVPFNGSLKSAVDELQRVIHDEKSNRASVDGAPASPLFARCRIQPDLPANLWQSPAPDQRDPRRDLTSRAAASRKKSSFWTQMESIDAHRNYLKSWPEELQHLADGVSDSYIALVKGDVDGLGHLQADLKWDEEAGHANVEATDFLYAFSLAVENAVRNSVLSAIQKVLSTEKTNRHFPFLPLVMAGDDIWILCRREHALRFAVIAGEEFAKLCGKDPYLENRHLSISFGVLFAKQGFPMSQQLDLAGELLHNAKAHRKAKGLSEACIDYFWLDSSGRESIREARIGGAGYHHLDEVNERTDYRLYTRPWKVRECREMLEASEALRVPRGKLKLLDKLVRMGPGLSGLGLHHWWSHLNGTQQSSLNEALGRMPERLRVDAEKIYSRDGSLPPGPWSQSYGPVRETALLELTELTEIATGGEEDETHEQTAAA